MLLWLLLALISLAVADGDQIRVTLVVDDREVERLSGAEVVVDAQPPVSAPLTDDGSCSGDMPGDHILAACFDIQKRETLSFGVLQSGQRLGAFNLFLPNASEATVSLRAKAGSPALLMDMAAEQPMYSDPEGPGSETRPKDKILVMVSIGGELGRGLRNPELRAMDRDDTEPVAAGDAGLLLGDKAGDGIWRADLAVLRTATLELGLFDGQRFLGSVELPLPAKQRCYVSLREGDSEGELIFQLDQEAPAADREVESILVMVTIDDSADRSLAQPELRVLDREGVEPVLAGDAGLLLGDRADDGLWRADLMIERTATLELGLFDGERAVGRATVDLPSKRRAYVELEPVDQEPGLLGRIVQTPPAADREDTSDPGARILVMLGIDDREAQGLTAPTVVLGDAEPVAASDAGFLLGDEEGDGLWRADVSVSRSDRVSLVLLDGEERVGEVEIPLPGKPRTYVLLRSEAGELVAELGLPAPGTQVQDIIAPEDRILLMLRIDDSEAGELTQPMVRVVDRDGIDPVAASDAGLLLGDEPDDGIWRADLSLARSDTVTLELLDEEKPLGSIELTLPAKPRASVLLQAIPEEPGVAAVLEQELPTELSPDGDVEGLIETSLLRISIQDSTDRSLEAPVVGIEGQEGVEPVTASDQGLLEDDEAGDGTWRADLTVLRTPTVTIALEDGEVPLGKATFSLPAAREVAVSLVRKGDPARLVVTTEAISSLGDQDSMVLVVELDDRAASLLEAPIVSIDQDDVEPAAALDDGSIPGDVADDGIFLVELEVVRNPRAVITVRDGETLLGSVDAPLPASDSTTVRLRTRHGNPAVALVEELDMGGGSGGGDGAAGGGNLWLIVWLNIGLFVVLFAWVRRTVRRAIDKELRARGGDAPPNSEA